MSRRERRLQEEREAKERKKQEKLERKNRRKKHLFSVLFLLTQKKKVN